MSSPETRHTRIVEPVVARSARFRAAIPHGSVRIQNAIGLYVVIKVEVLATKVEPACHKG